MGKLKIIHDKKGETLTIYFDKPSKNQVCEEAGDGVVLIKDKKSKKVIGFEKLYFKAKSAKAISVKSA